MPSTPMTLRTSEYPLECTLAEGRPRITSPGRTFAGSSILGRSTTPTVAGEVVIGGGHDARVLGHLAAPQARSPRACAAVGHALDDLCHVLGLNVTDGNVIQEEQYRRPKPKCH